MPTVQLLEDLPKAMLITVGVLTIALRVWSILDPRSAVTPRLRRLWSSR